MKDQTPTNPFDPEHHRFVRLHGFDFGCGLAVYEYHNHPLVDGTPDFLRLNLYLSKDGPFVTIWSGLLEPLFTESRLLATAYPSDFNFREEYNEVMFRGDIEMREEGLVILHALRIEERYPHPQVLSAPEGKLRCMPID